MKSMTAWSSLIRLVKKDLSKYCDQNQALEQVKTKAHKTNIHLMIILYHQWKMRERQAIKWEIERWGLKSQSMIKDITHNKSRAQAEKQSPKWHKGLPFIEKWTRNKQRRNLRLRMFNPHQNIPLQTHFKLTPSKVKL